MAIAVHHLDDQPTSTAGFLDEWSQLTGGRGVFIRLRGWARSPVLSRPADTVVIINQNREVIGETRVGSMRPDVAKHFDDPGMSLSGWSLTIDAAALGTGCHLLTAYARDANSAIAYKLQGSAPVSVASANGCLASGQPCSVLGRWENLLLNRCEKSEGRARLQSLPTLVSVELSRKCNLHCIMCYRYNTRFEGETMPDNLYESVREQLFPTATEICFGIGGEAFLHPRWDQIVEHVKMDGVRPNITTNGTLLTEARLHALIDAGFDLLFSIDGATPRTYSFIRGVDLSSVISRLRAAHAYRRATGRNIRVTVIFTPMIINYREMPQLVEMAAECGADQVIVQKFIPFVSTVHWAAENLPDYPRICEEAVQMAVKCNVSISIAQIPRYERRGPSLRVAESAVQPPVSSVQPRFHGCEEPFSNFLVGFDGDVYPCCNAGPALGNLLYQDVQEIWNGDEWCKLRKRLADRDPPKWCFGCHRLSYETPTPPVARSESQGSKIASLARKLLSQFR